MRRKQRAISQLLEQPGNADKFVKLAENRENSRSGASGLYTVCIMPT